MAGRFRDAVKYLVPEWLNSGDGEKVLYSWALLVDAFQQRMRDGLEARFPSRAGTSALGLIGEDRGIPRGRTEPNAHYAERLKRWRWPRGHRTRGNAFALLEQVSEYFGGLACYTIDVKGRRFDRSAAGVETHSFGNAWTWDTAGVVPRWARFWLVLSATVLGFDDAQALRELMHGESPWKPAGTRAEWVIHNLDGTVVTPDATWLHWSHEVPAFGTTFREATRYNGYRYVSLTPERNNIYAGDPDVFTVNVGILGFGYAGDPNSFPASVTLPNGTTYAGNPNNFPLAVRLFDDADWTLT